MLTGRRLFHLKCFIIITAIVTAINILVGGGFMDDLFGDLKQLFRYQQMLQNPQVKLKLGIRQLEMPWVWFEAYNVSAWTVCVQCHQ